VGGRRRYPYGWKLPPARGRMILPDRVFRHVRHNVHFFGPGNLADLVFNGLAHGLLDCDGILDARLERDIKLPVRGP